MSAASAALAVIERRSRSGAPPQMQFENAYTLSSYG